MSDKAAAREAANAEHSEAFERLRAYIADQMVMSHVYQPLMLKTLIENGGAAAVRTIASAFLAQDRSQLDYYEMIVNRYPRATLKKHGLIVRSGKTYSLAAPVADLTDQERCDLTALCDQRIDDYLARRGTAPWSHRGGALDPIPGRTWYDVIERAKRRCEACGVSAEERALHVDHIVPRSLGGSNDPDNLQALCVTCNLQKSNRSQTSFGLVEADYARRDESCPCCTCMVDGDDWLVGIVERTAYRAVIAPKRHVADYFALGQAEVNALRRLEVEIARAEPRPIGGLSIPTGPSVVHCHVVIEFVTGQPGG